MSYRVVLLPRAEQQLYEAALWWADNRSLDQALRWLAGFEATIQLWQTVPRNTVWLGRTRSITFPIPFASYFMALANAQRTGPFTNSVVTMSMSTRSGTCHSGN